MRKIFLLMALLFLAGTVGACGQQEPPADKIGVATTILPVADFVKNVGGEKVKVTVMVPPGASMHTYEPTPSQIKELAQARLYVLVGSGVEFELAWMDKIIQNNKNLELTDCSRDIQLIDLEEHEHQEGVAEHPRENTQDISAAKEQHEHHQGKDPHIWLSPKNARIMVENICAGLIKTDPANKDYYTQNKDKYLRELAELDKNLEENFKKIQNRNFLVFHPAWGYFARDYGFRQIPVEVGGKEPSAKELAGLIETAKKEKARVVFASPQFNPQSAALIAREIGGEVILVDPLPENYLENMRLVLGKFLEDALRN